MRQLCTSDSQLSFQVTRVVSLLAFVLFATLAGCGKAELSDIEYVQRAKDYQDKGDLRASEIELKTALQQNANNPEARLLLGKIYVEQGNGAAAEKELRRASQLGLSQENIIVPLGEALLLQEKFSRVIDEVRPTGTLSIADRAHVNVLRGDAYLGERKLDEATQAFGAALEQGPNLPVVQLGQARLAAARNKPEDVRAWIQSVQKRDPKSVESWYLLGNVERLAGNLDAADLAYGRVIEYGSAASRYTLSAHIYRGLVRVYLNKLADAKADIEAIKRRAPRNTYASYLQGLVYFQENRYNDAQPLFEKTVRDMPGYLPAKLVLGIVHYKLGHFQQAGQRVAEYVRQVSGNLEADKLLAVIRLRQGDFDGAEAILQSVVKRAPNDAQALALLGSLYVKNDNIQKGIAYLKKAQSIEPDLSMNQLRLGLAFFMEGDIEQGTDTLKTAIKLDPGFYQASVVLILAQMQSHRFEEALESTQQLKAELPNNPLPYTLEGLILLGKGKQAGAEQAFLQALQIAPGDESAAANLAVMRLNRGDTDGARSYYEDILKHHPGHVQTLLRLAALEARLGNVDKARAWYEEAAKLAPQDTRPRVALARIYLANGSPEKALEEVANVGGETPEALTVFAEAQLAVGQAARAKYSAERLVALQPNSADAHYLLAKVYLDQGDNAKAADEIKMTLKLQPTHLGAKVALIRTAMVEGKRDEANRLLGELKRDWPDKAETSGIEGWLAMQERQWQKAAFAYREAATKQPDSTWTLGLAEAQWNDGARTESLGTLEGWLNKHPEDVKAWFLVGNYRTILNDVGPAITAFKKVIGYAPNNVPALNNLAWYLRESDPKQALAYAERAYGLAPNLSSVRDTLGKILRAQGQEARAERILRGADGGDD